MADVEPEPQFVSLKDRINALNQQKAANATSATFGKRAPPPLPTTKSSSAIRPQPPARVQTINNPPIPTYGSAVDKEVTNLPIGAKSHHLPPPPVERDIIANTIPARNAPPALPGRKASQPTLQPGLPPRNDRRGSNASTVSSSNLSILSTTKTGSSTTSAGTIDSYRGATVGKQTGGLETQRKLPPALSDAKLPLLPPTRREREEREKEFALASKEFYKIPLVSAKSAPVVPIRVPSVERNIVRPVPSVERNIVRPVPIRPQLPYRPTSTNTEETPAARPLPPVAPVKSVLSMGFNTKAKSPTRSQQVVTKSNTPPPIPLSSKPTKSQVQAIKNRPPPPPPTECLQCRDFSRPDQVASLHSRKNLPRHHDITAYLAQVLCDPFPSATDKARAIFTWCHYNIAYDCAAFFGNKVRNQEPTDSIATGLAVCAGYAGVFAAIALHAGLECVTVNGYGKGYGYTPLRPTDPIPAFKSNHAWNAVRIDNGEWKLLDACWGAGNVSAEQTFNKHFEPSLFTMSNEHFGLKHFPSDARHFYRADCSTVSWEDYCLGPTKGVGEPVTVYDNICAKFGFDHTSFTPLQKHIPLSSMPANNIVRFQFSNICEHWDHLRHGAKMPPYPMVLKIGGVDGRKQDFVAFETNGFWWWCDVRVKDLGCRGGEVSVYSVESINGKDARGMGNIEFERVRRNAGMSFGGVAAWVLV